MAKYAGSVGYAIQVETKPGVWTKVITPKKMRGDVLRSFSLADIGDKVNDDLSMQNRISLIASPFAYENYSRMVYLTYLGTKWKIISVEVQRPRLIVTLGGVYNG